VGKDSREGQMTNVKRDSKEKQMKNVSHESREIDDGCKVFSTFLMNHIYTLQFEE